MSRLQSSIVFSLVSGFILVLGCSTTDKSQYPPTTSQFPPEVASWPINNTLFANKDFESIDIFLNRILIENPDDQTSWWSDYRRAQLWRQRDRNVSCENFARLAAQPRFPLARLAYLRAHEICPKTNQMLKRLVDFEKDKHDPWLSRLSMDVAIRKARQKRDQEQLIELLWDKSKLALPKSEKAELTSEALDLAKRYGTKKQRRRLQQRLYKLAPSKDPKPSRRDYLSVAQDHRYYRNYSAARRYYNKIIGGRGFSTSTNFAAYRGLRATYKVEQKRKEAVYATSKLLSYSEKVLKRSKKRRAHYQTYLDHSLLAARTYWTENQKSRAIKALDKAEKLIGKNVSLEKIHWLRGRMAEEDRDFKAAIGHYDIALKEPEIRNVLKERIQWRRAWAFRRIGELKKSNETLEEMIEEADNPFDQSRYRFWIGRNFQDLKDESEAEDQFEEIIDETPSHYYGFLAHRELGKSLPAMGDATKRVSLQYDTPKALSEYLIKPYVEWLIAVREDDVAKDYLNFVGKQLRKFGDANDEKAWAHLFDYYARSGNYQQLFAEIYKIPEALREDILTKNSQLLYPQPYREFVSDSANRFGISLEFIYSIMRQESAFNPNARSHMDAFGLMQLLPKVAKKSARENSIRYSQAEDLFEPHVNIPLGSAHLRKLWDKYQGDFVLAVASYNASEKAIEGWLDTRYNGDTLEFIEDIPYDETRQYVKLVLRNFIAYQSMGVENTPRSFPEWALRIHYKKRQAASE